MTQAPPRAQHLGIAGVIRWPLSAHPDARGTFTELFRREWGPEVDPVQWNVVRSVAGVLRGVHVHTRYSDYFSLVAGRMRGALLDLRSGSPSEGRAVMYEEHAAAPGAIVIPPGVAHGFYFLEPSLHVYANTHYWSPELDLGCHHADPALGIDWRLERAPLLSERDAALGSLAELRAVLAPVQPISPA